MAGRTGRITTLLDEMAWPLESFIAKADTAKRAMDDVVSKPSVDINILCMI